MISFDGACNTMIEIPEKRNCAPRVQPDEVNSKEGRRMKKSNRGKVYLLMYSSIFISF